VFSGQVTVARQDRMQMDLGRSRPTPIAWVLIGLTISVLIIALALRHPKLPQMNVAAIEGGNPAFSLLPNWTSDDHAAAFANFRKVCAETQKRKAPTSTNAVEQALHSICKNALAQPSRPGRTEARSFFEAHFTPYRIRASNETLITGYFEPELAGSLSPSSTYSVPIYSRPPDLVKLAHEASSLGLPHFLTAARKTSFGYQPYFTRQEIESGALRGRGLEIVYLRQKIDQYMMQIQGSALINLQEGGKVRLGFSAKNGYPYTSVSRRPHRRREARREGSAWDDLFDWLRVSPSTGNSRSWDNQSYVFFRRLPDDEARRGPHGAFGTPLTAGRSLAIDPRYHRYGLPMWVYAPAMTDDHGSSFARLMVAEDTGSAIRGPVRGDVFWGTGAAAGAIAGRTRHPCAFYVLWPRTDALKQTAETNN
jgi:membrane-bound lytic murein transglycosylase A